jgi:hypothetical protein
MKGKGGENKNSYYINRRQRCHNQVIAAPRQRQPIRSAFRFALYGSGIGSVLDLKDASALSVPRNAQLSGWLALQIADSQ